MHIPPLDSRSRTNDCGELREAAPGADLGTDNDGHLALMADRSTWKRGYARREGLTRRRGRWMGGELWNPWIRGNVGVAIRLRTESKANIELPGSRNGVKNLAYYETGRPISRSFFARCWDSTATATGIRPGYKGATNGRPPHLAKNERDMGHPGSWQGNRGTNVHLCDALCYVVAVLPLIRR